MQRKTFLVSLALVAGCLSPSWAEKPAVSWVSPHPSHHNKTRYGNSIRYVVIHTIEGSAQSGINTFKYSKRRVSAHYVIDFNGKITQMLRDDYTGWHAGNSRVNRQSIGIEHAGFSGRNQWTTAQYRASARLTRWACDTYGIPKERANIIGHNEVPGASHGDPGKYFDWALYMRLVREGDQPAVPVTQALRPAEGQILGRGHFGTAMSNGTYGGLTFEWSAAGTNQRGARVQVQEVGGALRYDSGYLPGNVTAHRVEEAFEHKTTYRWRALVFDGQKTVTGEWITFRTDFTAPLMSAISPVSGAVVRDTPVLRWRYNDSDGVEQVGYRVQIDDDEDHTKLIGDTKELNGATQHHFVGVRLAPGTTYHWRAMGHDGRANVTYTPWQTFRTAEDFAHTNTGGLAVEVRSPQADAVLEAEQRPVLRWSYHNGNQREQQAFRVQIDDDDDGSSYLLDHGYKNPTARGFRSRKLARGSYRWRVGVTDGQDTEWTEWASFSVGKPEGPGLTSVLTTIGQANAAPLVTSTAPTIATPATSTDEAPATSTDEAPAIPSTQASATAPSIPTSTPDLPALSTAHEPPSQDSTLPAQASTLPASASTLPAQASTLPASASADSTPGGLGQTGDVDLPAWAGLHEGLDLQGAVIPRSGVANPTLARALKVSATETLGDVRELHGRAFVEGTAAWFGGSRARGRTALTSERLNTLNVPMRPSSAQLSAHPENFYYVSMRWSYGAQRPRWWSDQRLLVVNPKTGQAVVVRPVDWAPHPKTGRIMGLSPQALRDLGAKTDEDLLVAFAAPGTSLGPK